MASQAKLGKGVVLTSGDGASPETFAAIPEILSIDGLPSGAPDLIDVTNHDSSGLYREKITGLIAQPDMNIVANYIKHAKQTALRTDMEVGTLRNFVLTFPAVGGTQTVTFAARITGFKIVSPVDKQQTLEFKLSPSGAPVWS